MKSSLENKVLWFYLQDASNLPVHHRRSLDQYGYPNLRSTKTRDEDQVLHKRTKYKRSGDLLIPTWMRTWTGESKRSAPTAKENEGLGNAIDASVLEGDSKVLMVDQLWLWVVDSGTCLTFFPSPPTKSDEEHSSSIGDLRESILSDINGDPRFATQCENVFDFAALVVSHAVRVLLEDMQDENLQIFRIFEEYISILIEHQTTSFKTFRNRYQERGAYNVMQSPGSHMSKALTKLQQEDIRDTEHDLTELLELKDIEDELGTINKLFKDQLRVIDQLSTQCYSLRAPSEHGLDMLRGARESITQYQEQVQDMVNDCKSAQESVWTCNSIFSKIFC